MDTLTRLRHTYLHNNIKQNKNQNMCVVATQGYSHRLQAQILDLSVH